VLSPTCTGLGERAHLMSRAITLDTFVQDIAGTIASKGDRPGSTISASR
jgi:hypothetical protein